MHLRCMRVAVRRCKPRTHAIVSSMLHAALLTAENWGKNVLISIISLQLYAEHHVDVGLRAMKNEMIVIMTSECILGIPKDEWRDVMRGLKEYIGSWQDVVVCFDFDDA